jgi:arylsulfatase A-like enzyme
VIYRVTAGVTVLLFLALGVTVLLAPDRIPPPAARHDHVRLLDRLESAAELTSPWQAALRRRQAAPPPDHPDWPRLARGDVAAVVPHVEAPRPFVEIRPRDPSARSLALRWRRPIETGREYRVTLEIALPLANRSWAPDLVEGTLPTRAAPTVRFDCGESTPGRAGDSETIQCRRDAAAFPAESKPAVTAEDPMDAARQELARLHRLKRVKEAVASHLEALARLDERHDLWFRARMRFTAPPDATHAVLGLDLTGLPGPLPVRWKLTRLERGANALDSLRGTYRYARSHGDTVFVKRMVGTPEDHRLSLVLAPSTVVGIDVEFPPGAELRFGVKAEPPLEARDTVPIPSRLIIEAEMAGGERIRLHEEVVGPAKAGTPARWRERTVSCAAPAGRPGRLRLRVDADEPDRGVVVALSDPILYRPGRGREKPSIVLITVDSLRHDYIGRTENGRSLTPNLDRFASESVRVSHAITGGVNTFVAIPGLMAGHPILGPEAGVFSPHLAVDLPTLADVLAGAGWFVEALTPDHYLHSVLKGFHRRFVRDLPQTPAMVDAEHVQQAMAFLETHRRDPFFLWLHLDDPHLPCLPKPEDAPPWEIPGVADPGPDRPLGRYHAALEGLIAPEPETRAAARRYLQRAYLAEVRYADAWVGLVLDHLENLGLDRRTVVAIHADHGVEVEGEGFGLRDFHDGTLHIPLLVRFPGVLPSGVERRGVMSLVDLAPTLLDLVGVKKPLEWTARSHADWLRGKGPITKGEPDLFANGWAVTRHEQRAVIRTLMWWYLADLEADPSRPKGTLLRCRDGEETGADVAADHPAVVEALDARIREAVRAGHGGFRVSSVSETMKRFLREAGYLPPEGKEDRQ